MKSILYTPKRHEIRQIINCIGYVEITEADQSDGWFGIFPNGSSNVTISLNHGESVRYHNNEGQSLLFTAWNSPVALKRTKSLKFINVQFKPYGLYMIKGIPMTELQNNSLTLDLFFASSEIEELLDRLLALPKLQAQFHEVENFLLKKFDPKLFDERIPHAISLMKNSNDLSIDCLSEAICLSSRRFREIFSEKTGFSPAFYKKTVRFNEACLQMQSNRDLTLTDIAYGNNYFDQSHFNKDFSFFAGITPSQFLRQKSKTTDFYNFNMTDLQNFIPRA